MESITVNSKFDDNFDEALQKKFIGLLIFDKVWAEMNGFDLIKPQYFENATLRNICTWIHDYHKQYKALPTKAIITQTAQEYISKSSLGYKIYDLYSDAIEDIFTRDESDDCQYYKDKVVVFILSASLSLGMSLIASSLLAIFFSLFIYLFWKKHSAFNIKKCGCHNKEFTHNSKIFFLHGMNILHILIRDLYDRYVIDIYFIFIDQMKEQIQWSFKFF